MTTVDQFVDQASAMLHSYTGTMEAATFLTSAINSAATVIPIAHPSYITRGLIEVGNELLHVDSVGDASCTLYPFGRGAQNTVPVSHAANTKVLNDPMYPRQRIFEAMKRCLHNIQLDLFSVATTTFTNTPVVTQYELPAGMIRVLDVQYQLVGPSREWVNIRNWTLDHNADTATGKAIIIHELIQPGRTVQVTYAAELAVPETPSTDLEATGIPEWMQSVLLYGTCWEIVQFLDPARLQLRSVEARTQAADVQAGAASNVAKQLYAMYQLRLDAARKRLLTLHPSPKHHTRY